MVKIGVLSDSHDNIWALERVLARLVDCDVLLCLGDICSPFTAAMICDAFRGAIHTVWGNNDGDRRHLSMRFGNSGHATLHGEFGEFRCDGRRIALTHYPNLAMAVASGGCYDLVCHGHNHQRDVSQVGPTTVLNPGEVMGRFGVVSCGMYDTQKGVAEIIELGSPR